MVSPFTISHLKNFCCNAWTFFLESYSWITETLSQITCVMSHAITYSTYFLLIVWHIRLVTWLSHFFQYAWATSTIVGSTSLLSTMPNNSFPMKITCIWNLHRWIFFPLQCSILPNSWLLEFAMTNTYQQNICKLINKLMKKRNLLKDLWAHNLKALIISKQTCMTSY